MSVPGSRTASPPRSAPQALKKKRTPRAPATHPTYVEMVRSAITALKERGGSSRQKIGGYIQSNYDVGNEQTRINARLRTALKSGVEKGVIIRSANSKGTGANGSFRVGKALPKKKAKKAAAKKGKRRAKSPKKKRRSPKKAKKSASKKKPKRAAKKAPKKARKSPAKKAKRSPKKKAAARRKPAAKGKKTKR